MAAYILRKIDPELWEAFKARAAAEGRGLRWVVLELVRYYGRHGLPTAPASDADASRGSAPGAGRS